MLKHWSKRKDLALKILLYLLNQIVAMLASGSGRTQQFDCRLICARKFYLSTSC